MNSFHRPDWCPRVTPGSRILVTGASGGIGRAVIGMLCEGPPCTVGAHGATRQPEADDPRIIALQRRFDGEEDCVALVSEFCERSGGIDALVVLSGGIHFSGHWMDMPATDWRRDMEVNLDHPFFLARAAMRRMKQQGGGGRIVLTGTESALHGGSPVSFPYAIAKRGTETMVQGLAREGAPDGILVNGVRLGYIASGFHERWHRRSPQDMADRARLVPLGRGGDPDEAAALILYLLSGWAAFLTGQMVALTGGDWL